MVFYIGIALIPLFLLVVGLFLFFAPKSNKASRVNAEDAHARGEDTGATDVIHQHRDRAA